MTTRPLSRAATLTGAAVLISAAGLLAAGCGSSSDSAADSTTERAAAAPQEVTLNATPPETAKAQAVSSAVGETVVYSVACTPGDIWSSARRAPLITKKSPDVPTSKECVDGKRQWAFVNTAAGTQQITFNGATAAEGSSKRAVVTLTITGPEPTKLDLAVTPGGERPAGQDVTLAVGDTLLVSAECNVSTGAKWGYLFPAAKSSVIDKSTTLVPSPTCVTPEGAAPGTPGLRQFAFDAKGAGTVSVVFREQGPNKTLVGRGAVNVTVE